MSETPLQPEETSVNRSRVVRGNSLSTMDRKLNLLNEKVDKLLNCQEDLTGKLQEVNQGIGDLEKGLSKLMVSPEPADQTSGGKRGWKEDRGGPPMDTQSLCAEILKLMKATHQDASKYRERIEKMEKMVDSVDKVVKYLGETFKNSKVVDFILKGHVPSRKGSAAEIPEETKDKPDEKGAKGKHAPSNKGIKAHGKNPPEENKRENKLDECPGGCEKVNLAGPVLPKADASFRTQEKMAQLEKAQMVGSGNSAKGCRKPTDTLQNHKLLAGPSGGNPTESPPTGDTTPSPEEIPLKHVNPKSKGSEKSISSRLTSPPREAEPSASKPAGEVTRTRLSINVQMSEVQDKTSKSKEGNVGIRGSKGDGLLAPLPSPSVAETAKHLPEPCKAKQASKSSGTEPGQESKGARPPDKPAGKQIPKPDAPPSPRPLATPQEKGGIGGKAGSGPHKVAEDSGRELANAAKGPKESAEGPQESAEEVKLGTVGSGSKPAGRRASRSDQGAGKPSGNAPALGADKPEELIIDDSPPPPAPFDHRIVSIKQTDISASYSVSHHEVLGGGRFGQVHRCAEKSTGLCLAAKIIKVKAAKEREEVKNEINIMNQLNHVNLIQLYDAFESKNNVTLIMEYVDGGELFDRIIDENYSLTELDAILFTKQICEGIHYLHQQYILHLDLKPENILCVNRTGNQIKIIDFGLARRYKPREKLKVNFGTPEFLAPEVVNYDFVSFPTDMWSVGVVAYMLISGLSPFLGESDAETMNYIVNCNWDFDAEAFEQVSQEAKDFVSRLLIKEKSGRMSAANCLKHEWLMDLPAKAQKSRARLKSQLLLRRYMAQRKWKKHFYVVAAANRLRRFPSMSENPA
uniref:Myosin light chain kinase 3 isoform X1 n=1 Tax=Pogona vitticeps TaxID=103695 RepID=A0ABM5ETW0_9SAUR